jgi:hypothetical protein
MGVIEAIRKGFGVASKNLGLVLVLFGFNLIWNLASIPFVGPAATAKPELAAIAVVISIVFILLSIFVQSGSLGLVRDYIKQGKMALGNFAGYGMKYYLRLFLLGLLIVLIIGVVGLLAALIVFATTPLNNTAVTIIAAIIAIGIGVVGVYYILLLMFSPYGIVCEELGVIESMKRSMNVVRKSIGKVLALLVLLILISMGLGFLIGLLTGFISVAMPVGAGRIFTGIISSIFNGYLGIVMMASFTALYLAVIENEKTSAQKVF